MTSLRPIKNAFAVTLVAALMIGCGTDSVGNPPSSGGSSQTGGGSGQAGMPASGGSGQGGAAGTGSGGSGGATCAPGCVTLCEGGLCDCYCSPTCEDYAAPPYDKSCTMDEDCFAGVHTTDCCGSKRVLGYNIAEQDRFANYEAACTAQALCACAAAEPTLESGQITPDLELRFAICSAGQCFGSGPVNTGNP